LRLSDHAPLGGWPKRGAFTEGEGRSRGGRTTAIHALTDAAGPPRVLLVAPGNLHDVMPKYLFESRYTVEGADSTCRPLTASMTLRS
jgi:hypothetical protein